MHINRLELNMAKFDIKLKRSDDTKASLARLQKTIEKRKET